MRPPRVPERVRDDPEPFNLADLVLDPDTKPAQPGVVFFFLVRQLAAFGLLVWIIDLPVFLVVSLIRAVAIHPRAPGRFRPGAAQREIVAAAGLRRRNAGDPALPRDDIFVFQRMTLLFSGIVLFLDGIFTGTMDGLLGAVDNQRLRFFPRDAGFALHTEQGLRQLLDTLDRPANRAFVHVVEEADELLGDVTPVIDEHNQQVILQLAGFPGAAGFHLASLRLVPRCRQLGQHPVERGHIDAGQAREAGAST